MEIWTLTVAPRWDPPSTVVYPSEAEAQAGFCRTVADYLEAYGRETDAAYLLGILDQLGPLTAMPFAMNYYADPEMEWQYTIEVHSLDD